MTFEVERAQLESILAPGWLAGRIEHIGSTAVPRLCAKPVIDIVAQSKASKRHARLGAGDRGVQVVHRVITRLPLQPSRPTAARSR
jgi:GrpB-like predicted nucleotidyltransferase (UPF0157 family)